jgi:FlaA1/EpsC-like NDP-sugar epimerase
MNNYAKVFRNKIILVTGGTGSIGSEVVRQLLKYHPKKIRIYSRDETAQFYLQNELEINARNKETLRFLIGDVRDKERLMRAMEDVDIVFHTAALKHVPYCERNPFEAVKTNVLGAQNIIDCALARGVKKVVAISSDKAVYPNTLMGVTKLLMERMVTSVWNYSGMAKTQFSAVRFGNVLESRGSVIPLWRKQIEAGGPVTVTDKNMKRFFMSIPDAVNLVFCAASLMKGGETFILKMEEKSIYELAQETIVKYGNGKKVAIKLTGAREREKLEEKLFTDEEKESLIDRGPFYILLPDHENFKTRKRLYNTRSKVR